MTERFDVEVHSTISLDKAEKVADILISQIVVNSFYFMLDSHVQEELRSKYNPEGSELRNLQIRTLDILKTIDEICRHNHITYWLGSGSLLGAVRHGGFIPWDDDIDIEIFRRDRCRFIEACTKELPSNLHVQYHKTEQNYFLNILKIRDDSADIGEKVNMGKYGFFETGYKYKGCFVDIFCVEPCVPFLLSVSNRILFKVLFWKFVKQRSALFCNFAFWLMEFCNTLFRLIGRLCSSNKMLYPGYSSCFGSECGYNAEYVQSVDNMMFENLEASAPINSDGYLIDMYGDYMELPSDKMRSGHHSEV